MHSSFEKHNPFRAPDWRFERALWLAERGGRCSVHDDEFVRKYRSFLRRWSASDDEESRRNLFTDCPGLYYAHTISERNDLTFNSLLQARLLSGQDFDDIAEASCMIRDAVRWYEALFFNVIDRLHRRDYIVRLMLGNPTHAGDDHFTVDMTLKFYAYFAGPLMLDFLVSGFDPGLDRPGEPRQVVDYAIANISHNVARRALTGIFTTEINQYNITELLNVHARLLEVKRMAESSGMRENDYLQNISMVLGACQFRMRQRPQALESGELPLTYDTTSRELRAHELTAIAQGAPGPSLHELNAPFPEARKPTHEDAQQGG